MYKHGFYKRQIKVSEVELELFSSLELGFILKVHLPSPIGTYFIATCGGFEAMKQDIPWDVGDELQKYNSSRR